MPQHEIQKMRLEPRRRSLTVSQVEHITPKMKRIVFTSEDLHDFNSPSPDDHIKVFLPSSNGERNMRDFTPRAFDPAAKTLVLDFALHQSGPATEWAAQAQVGAGLEIGGPRGSTVVPDDFDWYLLIGDETALPSIGRRVESLRAGVPVFTVVVLSALTEAQSFATKANWTPVWVSRDIAAEGDGPAFKAAIESLNLPSGDGFVSIAAESAAARELYTYMVDEKNHPKEWIKASSYWERGKADSHDRIA